MTRTFARTILTLAAIVACAMTASGCWWIERDMGHRIHIAGSVNAVEEHDLKAVDAATTSALKEIGYVVTTRERSVRGAMIQGNDSSDQRDLGKVIRVHLTERSAGSTDISIRIGRIGNKKLSRKLLDAIRANLGPAK